MGDWHVTQIASTVVAPHTRTDPWVLMPPSSALGTQDTDPAQYQLVKLLLAPSTSLFVVGDPNQAIYGWRGAEVRDGGVR